MKRCSQALAIREIQVKTTMRYTIQLSEWLKLKIMTKQNAGEV